MELKSNRMTLSSQERHWRPWFGKTGKLAMRLGLFLKPGSLSGNGKCL